jgi:hypothetical protein
VTSNITGNYVNTIPAGGVTSANAPASTAPATATLVVNRLPPPTVAKAFAPTPILVGQTSTLTITLANGNALAINGAGSPTPIRPMSSTRQRPTPRRPAGGTLVAAAGGPTVGLTNGTIPANGSCTIPSRSPAAPPATT